ncbi:PD-(D/E)XK nuclease family protein [Winogradskyella jejuensis]|uniref:PD-(D/E)XK nuclease superfamily protein n=1 Tax=Winogradskyella jejuensis TaxID=1089305 RepID=A0A1M5N7P8_9FLAO|nr:PD-(D/E)XK nuclease family protein [Winogradskyella jejuensis]SHG85472.1 PD-(D/E)XK nuclease superfamily protein [Winogradskyella jejuensis]
MVTFIEDVLRDLKKNNEDFSNCIFILPSKRAGVFLKSQINKYISHTSFAPEIISIEDFVQDLSQLRQVSGIELLFQFYSSYIRITPKEQVEPFETFSKWAQILIQDFNEIDRYLVSSNQIFDYLSAIQELNHWSLKDEKTELVTNYLSFWKNLKSYYTEFTNDIIASETAYQGLIYKEATEHIETYIQNTEKRHIFLGFNALNTSEEHIIQELLQNNLAYVYWDADSHFINNKHHSAGLFSRQHKSNWIYYKTNPFNWIKSNYKEEKNITVIGCPKSVGQSKYVGHLLKRLSEHNQNLSNTAIVLGDEMLLSPLLNSLPESIKSVNVTMGLPLKAIALTPLFEQIFTLHKLKSKQYYYKDVVGIISNQMLQYVLDSSQDIIKHIQQNNIVYLSNDDLLKITSKNDTEVIKILFDNWEVSMSQNIEKCVRLIEIMRLAFTETKSEKRLELEYLYRFNTLFNEMSTLNSKYGYINDVSALFSIYKELLNTETLDFQGEPLEGLQIMGMLESRVLDFETVIITSVNEGILPGGKTNNSFIPYDVKIENNLPTYKEKDAVYTYHFYNLIQRAKNVYLIYNTEVDALKGGEKSRFITQLEVDGIHDIKHQIASPKVPKTEITLTTIKKDIDVIEKLKIVASKGFSPSSLTNYIRNPIDFYFEKILEIESTEEVEETVAANTLGTVVHNTLEDFYKPFEAQLLSIEDLQKMKSLVNQTVSLHFKNEYKQGDITTGKNLITFEIAKRYVTNFINSEIELLQNGNTLKIVAVEVNNSVTLSIPELNFPIKLKGKVDRVDELNGVTRVIDYKSGKVEQNKVEIVDWEDLNTDYNKYSKSFQVLCYAYMMHAKNQVNLPIEAGIISFKNLKEGFLKFGKKESSKSRSKNQLITEDTLNAFEIQLKNLILEICNPDLDFVEKELD